jgi:hypothetical protein
MRRTRSLGPAALDGRELLEQLRQRVRSEARIGMAFWKAFLSVMTFMSTF